MATKWEPYGGATEKPGVYPRQNLALAVVVATPLISLAFTALRFHAKRRSGWGLDDLTIMFATLLSIVVIYPSWKYMKLWHVGIHIWDINQRKLEPPMDQSYKMLIWFNVCNAFILPLVKASILFLLLKVGGVINNVRKFVYGVFVLNALSCFIVATYFLFQCPPKSGNKWHDRTFGQLHCAGRVVIGRVAIFQVCISMFTDLLIFPIPCYLTWKLQKASFRNRMIVVFLFSLSLAVTGIGAAKIHYTYRDRLFVSASDDWTYEIIFTITHWENCVAIVVACIPSLRVLILRWLGKEEGSGYVETGGSPIRITGAGPASAGHTQRSARESFLARLRPPAKKRGLYDTTIGDQTIDLENCVVKSRFDETIMEEDHDGASCGSKTEINFYRSESVSTIGTSDNIEKPPPSVSKY